MDFSQFIDAHGFKVLAIVFGVPEATIRSWKKRNKIPRDRWDRLLEVYTDLNWRKLRDMEIASATVD